MKKFKRAMLAISAVAMSLILCFAVGCSCQGCKKGDDPVDQKKELTAMELDTSAVKTDYLAPHGQSNKQPEAFTAEGLVVKVTYTKEDGTPETADLGPTSEGVIVDSSEFKNTVEGTYKITVFYSYGTATLNQSYNVNVIEETAGLNVTLKSNYSEVVTLNAEGKGDLSGAKDWIEVRLPDSYGNVDMNSTPLAASEYTVELYKGQTKIEEADWANLTGGTYNLWAVQKVESGYVPDGFVLIYVVDAPTQIALAPTAKTSQTVSTTNSLDWAFVVTYQSGRTENKTLADVTVTGLDTTFIGANKTAKVAYKETVGKNSVVSVENDITYSITAPASGEGVKLERAFSYAELKKAMTVDGTEPLDNAKLKNEYFTGVNSFITVNEEAEGNVYRASNNCVQIKDDGMTLVVQGEGKLSVTFASTGGSNDSAIGLKKDGEFITTNITTTATAGSTSGTYVVHGTSGITVTWDELPAGTYTLWSNYVISAEDSRGCRLSAITLEDTIGDYEEQQPNPMGGTYEADLDALANVRHSGSWTDKMDIQASDFTGVNSFITFTGSTQEKSNFFRTTSGGAIAGIEMQGEVLEVNFVGTGTLTIKFRSNSSSNTSCLGVKKEGGNLLEATTPGGTPEADGTYSTNDTVVTVIYTINSPGKYIIVCGSSSYNRVTRITGIKMVDNG